MGKEKEFWNRIKSGLADEMGVSLPSKAQLEKVATSTDIEPLNDKKIEQILSAGRPESTRERTAPTEKKAYPSVPPPVMISREMTLALNRNRGSQEPDVDKKVAKLRAEALKEDDDPGDGDAA